MKSHPYFSLDGKFTPVGTVIESVMHWPQKTTPVLLSSNGLICCICYFHFIQNYSIFLKLIHNLYNFLISLFTYFRSFIMALLKVKIFWFCFFSNLDVLIRTKFFKIFIISFKIFKLSFQIFIIIKLHLFLSLLFNSWFFCYLLINFLCKFISFFFANILGLGKTHFRI